MGTSLELAGRARPASGPTRPSFRRGALIVVALFLVTLLAARACQRSQLRISESRAIAVAREHVDFTPQRTQIRLVRQGLSSHPYWAVSLSVPSASGGFKRITVVRVDANSGTVAAVTNER